MKILVTGANGFLGRGVVDSLIAKNNNVIAADFSVDKISNKAERIECNLFEIKNPYEFFGKPDIVLHMAWRDGFVHNSDAHIDDLPKHCHFINKMYESGVKQIAVIGTMHEIGFFEGSIDENTPCNPMSLYGISKNALRRFTEITAAKYDAVFQWLRGYYIVSNTSYGNSVFSKIVKATEDRKTSFPFTMGQNQYDFIDYEDFCEQVACAVTQNEINGIINICSGKPEKLADRVESFIKENSFDINLEYGAFPDRPYDSKAVWGNSDKIERIMKVRYKEMK